MKTKLIIFISLALICCNKNTKQKAEVINIKQQQLDGSVFGVWQMCKSTGGGEETSYNVCPTILFSEDGTGNIKSLEKKYCDFQFSSKNDRIVFSFKSANDRNAFFATGTEFIFKFNIANNIEILELSQLNTDYKFILSRISR